MTDAPAPAEPLETAENRDTIEFIFELGKDLPERQARDWEAMETKAVQLLTAASVIVGLASLGSRAERLPLVPAALFGVGLAAYLVVLVQVARVLWIRDIRLIRQLDWLWENRAYPPLALKDRLIEDLMATYRENAETLTEKAGHLRPVFIALGVEAVCVLGALIWSRLVG